MYTTTQTNTTSEKLTIEDVRIAVKALKRVLKRRKETEKKLESIGWKAVYTPKLLNERRMAPITDVTLPRMAFVERSPMIYVNPGGWTV